MRRKKGVQEGFNTFLNALFLFHFISKMFSFFLQSNTHLFPQLLLPKDPTLLARFWTLLERMVTTLPFYLLQCNREPEAMQLSYKTMRGAPPPKGNTCLFSSPSER